MKVKYNNGRLGEAHSIKLISGTTLSPNHVESIDQTTVEQSTQDKTLDKPQYSTKIDNEWYGLDTDLEKVTKGFRTHKELKHEYGVDSVKGYKVDGDKYYALIYKPMEVD